jgi:hypothetical protein
MWETVYTVFMGVWCSAGQDGVESHFGAMPRRAAKPVRTELSSGNVFADLGLPDAAELDTKVRLAVEINRLIKD